MFKQKINNEMVDYYDYVFVYDDDDELYYAIQSIGNTIKLSSINEMIEKKKQIPVSIEFTRGLRVKVNNTSGFDEGASGIIEFVEPNGYRIWILRDGATEPCWFSPSELDLIVDN